MKTPTHTLNKHTRGYTLAAAWAVLFNTVLTWIKELYPSVNAAMKSMLGHHWITHGVAVVLAFLVLGVFFSRSRKGVSDQSVLVILVASVVVGAAGLVTLFLIA